jgi:ribonuclease III
MMTVHELQSLLDYEFKKAELLQLALTHKSFANEQANGEVKLPQADNERLEYLGDAVLDLALSEILMLRFGADPEGALSKKRASLVNEETLSQIALELKLDQLIRVGKGEAKSGGLQKPRILASALEAVFGALHLDGGYGTSCSAVKKLFAVRMDELEQSSVDFKSDFKTRFQEKIQELHRATPTYQVESESGPDHDKKFEVSVRVQGEVFATGTGKSKKAAEQDAARQALEKIG